MCIMFINFDQTSPFSSFKSPGEFLSNIAYSILVVDDVHEVFTYICMFL